MGSLAQRPKSTTFRLYGYRYLIWVLTIHDFMAQHLDSMLGALWSILKPLVLIGLYAFVFSVVVGPTVTLGGKSVNFGLFLFAGMLPWSAIQESVQRSANVFIDQVSLVRHHTIPLAIYPLAVVLSSTISGIFVIMVFVLFKLFLTGEISSHGILLLLVIPLQIIFSYGYSLLVSTLNVFSRDVYHVSTTVLAVLFFTSPIIFPPGDLPEAARELMWLNPLTGYVLAYRDLLLMDRLPGLGAVVSILLFTTLSLLVGVLVHAKMRKQIVDRA